MQTLKNLHEEYLNKLAEEIVIKACVKECKCDFDYSIEKKKCLFRKTLNGSNNELVDSLFDMIDAVSEIIYIKTVDGMAYPKLIKQHFANTKAKIFYSVISNDYESVISEIFKKVCLKIPDICRENPGFEELTNYAKQKLLEYFTFKKVFSYSRYMIENHSYIEDWFPIADMDTEEILEAAEREPRTLYMTISKNNYKYTKNLEELLEYTYSEMYEKNLLWLKNIFIKDVFKNASDYYNDGDIVFKNGDNSDEYVDEDDDEYKYKYKNGLKYLIECYKNHGVSVEKYYSDVNVKIGHIIVGTKNGAAKKKTFGDIVDEEGNYIEGKCKEIEFICDKKLAASRLEIYKSQMIPLNDNMYYGRNSKSKGDFNKLVRSIYKDLYGLDLSKIYKKAPYNFHDTKDKKHPLWFPKCVDIANAFKKYKKCIKNDEYKMLKEWPMQYNRLKIFQYIFIQEGGEFPDKEDIPKLVDDVTIEDESYYMDVFKKYESDIEDEASYVKKAYNDNEEALKAVIEALTIALFIISPDYDTIRKAIKFSDNTSKKTRHLIEMIFSCCYE